MPEQKIVLLSENEQVEDGWWFVKLLGKETRFNEVRDEQETVFIALLATTKPTPPRR